MKQQTAVEWLEERIQRDMTFMEVLGLIKQAKEMEKEQIMNAFINGEHQQGFEGEAEQYYNETYES